MKKINFLSIILVFFAISACSGKKKDAHPPIPPIDPSKTPEEISADEREAELKEEVGNDNNESDNNNESDKYIKREILRSNHEKPKSEDKRNTAILYPLDTSSLDKVKKQLSSCGKKYKLSIKIIVDPKGIVYLKPNQAFPTDAFKCIQKNISSVKLNPGKFRKGVITLP